MNTEHLTRIAKTLDQALIKLDDVLPEDELYDLFRNSAIKSFELGIETAGKALRRALKSYVGSVRTVYAMTYNDVLRQAAQHHLLGIDEAERWLIYRKNRNTTAHDYGEHFAAETLPLLPQFVVDLRAVALRLAVEE
jgi:nucleotidyltransferase substrate binding protein (TIGR01987 family)